MEKRERDSGLELLRIIALLLIFWMHGASGETSNELNKWFHIIVESVGNIGVTLFMLISGYFGVKLKPKKMIRLEFMLLFYCWIGLGLHFLWGDAASFGGEKILTYIFPVIGRNSWYFTCYFALVFLSPFLNDFIEKIDRAMFRRLLLTMLIIFSGITTFFFFDITQDGGKGIVNMVMAYFIGRYIRIYLDDVPYKRTRLIGIYLVLTGICIALNGALYVVTGTVQNRFARDCTLFIIFEAVCIFLIFKDIHFKSRFINRAAGCVPAVFTMEWTLRGAVTFYLFDYLALRETNWHQWILVGISLLLIVAGTVIEWVRLGLFGRLEEKAADAIYGRIRRIGDKIGKKIDSY